MVYTIELSCPVAIPLTVCLQSFETLSQSSVDILRWNPLDGDSRSSRVHRSRMVRERPTMRWPNLRIILVLPFALDAALWISFADAFVLRPTKTATARTAHPITKMGMGNSFGRLLRISTWGESHGGGVGVVVDGCPPKIPLCVDDIQIGASFCASRLQPDLDTFRLVRVEVVRQPKALGNRMFLTAKRAT